jgi:hypothetical protein
MSRLSTHLQLALDELKCSARSLEQRAGLPPMTVRGIMDNAHPRTERFEKLLSAIPRLDLRLSLLIAYTLDDTPESQRPAVEAVLNEHLMVWHQTHNPTEGEAIATIAEEATVYRIRPSAASQARQVVDAMRQAIDEGDTDLTNWLATTGQLLLAPHLQGKVERRED